MTKEHFIPNIKWILRYQIVRTRCWGGTDNVERVDVVADEEDAGPPVVDAGLDTVARQALPDRTVGHVQEEAALQHHHEDHGGRYPAQNKDAASMIRPPASVLYGRFKYRLPKLDTLEMKLYQDTSWV